MLLKYIVGDNKNLRSILKDELNISSRLFNKIKNKYVFVNGEHAIYYKELNVNDVVEVDFSYDDDNYNNIVSNRKTDLPVFSGLDKRPSENSDKRVEICILQVEFG